MPSMSSSYIVLDISIMVIVYCSVVWVVVVVVEVLRVVLLRVVLILAVFMWLLVGARIPS